MATQQLLRSMVTKARSYPSRVPYISSRPALSFAAPFTSSPTRAFSSQTALRAPYSQDQEQEQPMPKFAYHVAAAFTGKKNRFDPLRNFYNFDPHNPAIPQTKRPRSERHASGQDAFFISPMGDSKAVAFGIADGVGGWEESGVDPADFSHAFCDYMALAASKEGAVSKSRLLSAKAIMQKGYDATCADKTIQAGGSTAVVGVASEDGTLDVSNLGDSGFVHLRLNAVHSYSDPQTHAFNTPYQLSIIPASMLARAAAFGGAQLCDYPKDSDVTSHSLQHGDVLIFASDGVWDNLFNQDILRAASQLMTGTGAWHKSKSDAIEVADNLAPLTDAGNTGDKSQQKQTLQSALAIEITARAKAASLNQRIDGPFSKEVQRYYPGEDFHGGKIDDICVVVVVVSEQGRAAGKSKL